MTTAEKISIAMPPEMVVIVRSAVASGEYASSSEVIRAALRDDRLERKYMVITDTSGTTK